MQTRHIIVTITWLKRLFAAAAIAIWLYVLTIFINDPAPFSELAPYCMGSTMVIFGILTGIFKGLEHWEGHIRKQDGQKDEKKDG